MTGQTKLNELSYADLYSIWETKPINSQNPLSELKSKLEIVTKRLKEMHKEGLVELISDLPSAEEIKEIESPDIYYTIIDLETKYFPNETTFNSYEDTYKEKLTKGLIQGSVATLYSGTVLGVADYVASNNIDESILKESLIGSFAIGSIFAINAFYSKKSFGDYFNEFITKVER